MKARIFILFAAGVAAMDAGSPTQQELHPHATASAPMYEMRTRVVGNARKRLNPQCVTYVRRDSDIRDLDESEPSFLERRTVQVTRLSLGECGPWQRDGPLSLWAPGWYRRRTYRKPNRERESHRALSAVVLLLWLADMRYRPDIDGLRAVAVISVLLYHLDVSLFTGGFVGVDVFFVISGYLITSRLLSMREEGRFTFSTFYVGRVRRLFPALFVTLSLSFVAAVALFVPSELERFSRATVSAVLFGANFFFWSETGYWDPGAETKPLLHTWSLSVEEQLYVIWPALIALVVRSGSRKVLFGAFFALSCASLFATEVMLHRDPSGAFFLMPFRIFEFGIGALCVGSERLRWPGSGAGAALREMVTMVGLVMISAAVIAFDPSTRFPGFAALLPCVGTAFVVVAGPASISGRLLASWPFVWIGKVSYSLYLIHWPLIVFVKTQIELQPSVKLALIVLSVGSALLMFRYVETPLRYPKPVAGQPMSAARVGVAAAVPSFALMLACVAVLVTDGLPNRYRHDLRWIAMQSRDDENTRRLARAESMCGAGPKLICGRERPDMDNVVIVGDSHGPDGLNILATAYPRPNYILLSAPACPPVYETGSYQEQNAACVVANESRWNHLSSLRSVSTIVFAVNVVSSTDERTH